jgi:undecaprenyl-diphosphatase
MVFDQIIKNILPSLGHLGAGGYWIAFFAALLETTIGLGLILPGSTIILFLGALSSRGYLDVGDLIWFSILGAIIGDNINYFLGRKYFNNWLQKGFWFLKSGQVEKASHFMDTHGAKSVFLGRFIPSVKELVPFIAGSLRMDRRKFIFWNILGAIGWGFEWVLAGYIFAKSLNLAQLWLSRAGLFFAFLLLFGGIIYFCKWLITKKGKQFLVVAVSLWQSIKEPILNNQYVRAWIQEHPRSLSFLRARFDTTVFSGLTLSILTLALIYVLALFGGIVEDLLTLDPIVALDIRAANLFLLFRTGVLTDFFTWVTVLGKAQVIVFFILITASLLWLWRKKYYILPLAASAAGSVTFTFLGKLAFHRPRPAMAIYAENSYSFPSGHATIAIAFYGFAAYLLMRFASGWNRKVNIFFAAVLIILAIGFSRIYLGVHYISDVWCGYLVGSLWLIIAIAFSEWLRQKNGLRHPELSPVRRVHSMSLALVAAAIIFYAGFSMNYHPPLATTPEEKTVTVSKSTDIFTKEQMKYTETLFGKRQEPLNFIFLTQNDSKLIKAMQKSGWTLTNQANIPSFLMALKALVTNKPHPAAPIVPSFWQARIQDLNFAKVPSINWLRDARHVKIWRTNYLLPDGNRIYLGLVNANEGFMWGIIPKISPDLNTEREQLVQDLQGTGQIVNNREVQLVKPQIGENFIGERYFTDGKAYIVSVQ